MKIAILGAPATGKTELARRLARERPRLSVTEAGSVAAARDCARVLLLGLDLPCPAGIDARLREQADTAWRAALRDAGLAHGVVYGLGEQRLRNALRLIEPEAERPRKWNRACEKCSDPDCEHQLFTGLTRSMAADRPLS